MKVKFTTNRQLMKYCWAAEMYLYTNLVIQINWDDVFLFDTDTDKSLSIMI